MPLRSVVGATSYPESVCGKDERVRVNPETSPPYNWICSLEITEANGTVWVGSGFKIHIPNMNCCIVVTSAHCVYVHGAYATRIKVTFPGQADVTATQADLYASPEYRNQPHNAEDYDYGIIALHGNSDEGFGWSAIIPDSELFKLLVTNCGNPGDKHPWPQMWITGGEITKVTANRLFYMNDTMGGQSGSPVYTWYKRYWTVVGVHGHGGCPNSAPRVTSEMIYRFLDHTQNLGKYALKSATAFPNVYLRCDGSSGGGKDETGGTVNCQYKPPGIYEALYIYPVEIPPSLAQEQTYIVVLQSSHFNDAYIRLDGSGMTQFNENGGGVVNCHFAGKPPRSYETFFLKKGQNDLYSLQSVAFPNCYIRLDGTGVTSQKDPGGGVVNCQYYNTGEEPSSYEHFILEKQ